MQYLDRHLHYQREKSRDGGAYSPVLLSFEDYKTRERGREFQSLEVLVIIVLANEVVRHISN